MPILNVTLNEKIYAVEVPDRMLTEAGEFFGKMDRDMDRGWQMSREFVERPDLTQRAQIAAHRLMLAMTAGNETVVQLMAGYILTRLPTVSGVEVDTEGDMTNTAFTYAAPTAGTVKTGPLNKIEAMKQAGKEVTAVYQSGRSFRFAVLDRATGQWVESSATDEEKDAQDRRMQAFKQRFAELTGVPDA